MFALFLGFVTTFSESYFIDTLWHADNGQKYETETAKNTDGNGQKCGLDIFRQNTRQIIKLLLTMSTRHCADIKPTFCDKLGASLVYYCLYSGIILLGFTVWMA
jgi:hypothetical protein